MWSTGKLASASSHAPPRRARVQRDLGLGAVQRDVALHAVKYPRDEDVIDVDIASVEGIPECTRVHPVALRAKAASLPRMVLGLQWTVQNGASVQGRMRMKKLALAMVLGLSMFACKAQVRVQAKIAEKPVDPPKVEEPAPAPEPQQGEQISLPDQIEFELDEARIKQTPKTLETLQKLAEIMKKNPRITKLRIEGHTDDLGTKKHNEKLSKARAEAVAKWLAQHDIEEKRLVTVGHGARKPVVPNDSADHRAQNRRTEYYVDEVDGTKVAGDTKTVAASGTTNGGKSTR